MLSRNRIDPHVHPDAFRVLGSIEADVPQGRRIREPQHQGCGGKRDSRRRLHRPRLHYLLLGTVCSVYSVAQFAPIAVPGAFQVSFTCEPLGETRT